MTDLQQFRRFLMESNYRCVPVARPTAALLFRSNISAFQKLLVETSPEVVFVTECVAQDLLADCGLMPGYNRNKAFYDQLVNLKSQRKISKVLSRGLEMGEIVFTIPIAGQLISLSVAEPWYQEGRLAAFRDANAL